MHVADGQGRESGLAVLLSACSELGVEAVDRSPRELLQLSRAEVRARVALDVLSVAAEGREADGGLDRQQSLVDQVLVHGEVGGRNVAMFGDSHEHLVHRRPGLLAGGKARLGLAAAFLDLGESAAALRALGLRSALDPEAPAAVLAPLRRRQADVDDVLEARLASPANVTLHASSNDDERTRSTEMSVGTNRCGAPVGTWSARPAYGSEIEAAGLKWVSGYPSNPASDLPIAVMDASWITAMRTGASAGICAKYLAVAHSSVVAIIGCGVQNRSSLAALRETLPHLREERRYDRLPEASRGFVAEMLERFPDLSFVVCGTAPEVVRPADVVVSLPSRLGSRPILILRQEC